ncbi:hydroxymethylbilane synthase, partial [Bacillus sp. JJ1521]
EGGCQIPIAAYATMSDDKEIALTALVGSPDGKIIYKEQVYGNNPIEVGNEAAKKLTDLGAKDLIDQVKEELNQ